MGAFLRSILVRRVAFTLLTLCVIAAIIVQDHTRYLPLGVFNSGSDVYERLANLCLAGAVVVLILQLIELFTGRLALICGVIRGLYVSVIILDVLLAFGDRFFVTGNPGRKLGQYYEVPDSGHPPVMLKKDFSGHGTPPCLAAVDSVHTGPRILFLGDSYTEGSGSAPPCNYPTVVERTLREQWNPGVRVVNAGVSGYGPVEALSLLKWYRGQGCPVAAVVYTLTLENDLSDNLPRTERHAVAGIIFRFPSNGFLRAFHPLNTRVFRWALVLVFFGKASTQEMLNAVSVRGGPCDLTAKPLEELSPFLRASVARDQRSIERVAHSPRGYDQAAHAVSEMREIAGQMQVPFVIVVFPDRLLVDRELRTLMGSPDLQASMANYSFAAGMDADRVVEVYGQLEGRAGLYRTVDTHLSDAGNVVAGVYVGSVLAEYFSTVIASP